MGSPDSPKKVTTPMQDCASGVCEIKSRQNDNDPIAIAAEFVALSENIELEAYPDPLSGGEPWTIGYGTTIYPDGRKVKEGDHCTEDEARVWLNDYLQRCYNEHFKEIPYWEQMTAHQQAAILSLDYNEEYAYADGEHDSLDAALADVPSILMKYRNKSLIPGDENSKVELGLGRRRYAEGLLWKGKSPAEAYKIGWEIDSVSEFA
jgi:GH24 family phage-related lysozyme (muramidase)